MHVFFVKGRGSNDSSSWHSSHSIQLDKKLACCDASDEWTCLFVYFTYHGPQLFASHTKFVSSQESHFPRLLNEDLIYDFIGFQTAISMMIRISLIREYGIRKADRSTVTSIAATMVELRLVFIGESLYHSVASHGGICFRETSCGGQ